MASHRRVLGVALFGVGRIGEVHLRNVMADGGLRLLYAVDERLDRVKHTLSLYDGSMCSAILPEEASQVYSDDRVDFVIICTPTRSHEKITLESLNAGKGVFCEKPLTSTEEAAVRCYDAAATAHRPLFCSFNRRFDPSLRAIFKARSEIGKIHMVKICARDSGSMLSIPYLKDSGGYFHDSLVHDIDLICWIAGEYPTHVYACASCHNPDIKEIGDVDTAAIIMKFKSGTLAMIDGSRDVNYGYDQRMEVYGDKCMMSTQNQRPNTVVVEDCHGQRRDRIYDSFVERYEKSYVESLRHFTRVMRGEEQLEVTKENTINVFKITAALNKSAQVGCQVDITY